MHFRTVRASLVLIGWIALQQCAVNVHGQAKSPEPSKLGAAQDVNRNNAGPLVEGWDPKTGSIDTVIYLTGYRLYQVHWDKTKAFFIQNKVEVPARTAGGWSRINDLNGSQTLGVLIPEEVVPGPAQIVVELEGRRSSPVPITITEWKLPTIKGIEPKSGAPGTFVRIECEGFHVNDEFEVNDDKGKPIILNNGSSSGGTTIRIPEDVAEGVLTIKIGNSKYGKGEYTPPVTFTVTNEPLPVELYTSDMHSVAPGQWLDLQISNLEPIKRSELTEISFNQGERTIIVATSKPFRTHVAVPSSLSAGEVQLQLRTWRGGRASQWSEPASFELASKPIAPIIETIKIENGDWAALTPGPDRKTSFTVSPGDEVVLYGLWPVADASQLKVTLICDNQVIGINPTDADERANWFSNLKVHLPESLEVGDWRMIVSSKPEGIKTELPIAIRVVKK